MKGAIRLIKILNWKQIKGVAGFFFSHPLLFLTSVSATANCLRICDRIFGKAHHLDSRANAFRHALWNMMIMRNARVLEKDCNKVLQWTENLTDWHEAFSPNRELAKTMDLHNNATGRAVFMQNFREKKVKNTQLTQALLPLLKSAGQIVRVEDVHKFHGQLVYIKEEE